MGRAVFLAIVIVALSASTAWAAGEPARHSGRLVDIRDGGRVLVIEEMGPWVPPNSGLSTRTIAVAPGADVRLVVPTGRWDSNVSPGYEVRAIAIRQIKPGDFVTVTLDGRGTEAATVEVVDQAPAGAGLASPSPGR